MNGTWEEFWELEFFEVGQRRGADVNTPKIGSRVGLFCFGGIYGFYAVLRRELFRRNFKWDFFEGLGGDPRGSTEEGGDLCVIWGNFNCSLCWVLWTLFSALRGDLRLIWLRCVKR
jgi:hypothetical protein